MEMMEESLRMILELWGTEPPYKIQGKHWNIDMKEWTHHDIKLGYVPKPLQQPHPPIAISAMSPYSGSLKFAGRNGYIPVSANFIAPWSVATHWPAYCAGAKESNVTPESRKWRVARSIFVADSDAEAEEFIKQKSGAFDYYYEYLFSIFDKADFKGPFVINKNDDPSKLTHQMLRDACVISGSPETVSDELMNLMDEIGDFGTILYAAHDWTDKSMMIKSMELFANEVMPRVNRKLNTRQASAG